MLTEQSNNLLFGAHFTNSGAAATGLTVTVDVYEITFADTPVSTLIKDDQSATEVGGGLYIYLLTAANVDADAVYVALFYTAGTVDQDTVPAAWTIGKQVAANVLQIEGNDATDTIIGADGDTLETLSDQIDGIGAVGGAGAIEYVIEVQYDGAPLDGAEVWVTSNADGTGVVAGTLTTAADGLATFMLDAGTYYAWVQHSGYNGTNPTTIVVS